MRCQAVNSCKEGNAEACDGKLPMSVMAVAESCTWMDEEMNMPCAEKGRGSMEFQAYMT
jgi:hypothetical protein